ncbi:SspB-related isopeptide-forming adhesin [Lactococcus lactis]|uniref:SspB-related isopeptide-forming adhesin n=1 Tax=Lactococcus lactis TaxID=1358 RepID=UPI00111D48BF|nr:SspB-related isopeptide-forming adhesin [Lactococcus lactis]TNU77521.1 cell surface protein [Lactococcus lactis subsp. lactis]
MKKTLKDQLLEVSKAHLNWKKKTKVFIYGTAILLMAAPSLASSVSRASADEEGNAPKVTQAGERSGKLDLNVSRSSLDQAISEAKSAGLTLKEEATQDKGNAQGTEAISKLQKTISDDYASQTSTIQKQTSDYKSALAKYNQAEADYKKKLDDIQNAIDNHEPGAPSKAIGQGLNFKSSQNPNAVIKDVKFSGAGNGALLKAGTLKDGMGGLDSITAGSEVNSPEFYTVGGAGNAFGLFLDKGQSVTITYSNLKSLTVGKTAAVQIKATFKNPSGNRMGLILPKDPGNQFHFGIYANGKIFTNQPQAVQQTYQFYDALGKIIPFITTDTAQAQFMVGSLNYSKAKTQDGGMPPNDDGYNAHESASFDNTKAMGSPFGRSSISQVSGVPISGSNATGDSWGSNPAGTNETWSAKALNDYKYNGALMDTTQWDTHSVDAWYGAFSLVPKDGETSVSVTWHTTSANMWASFNGQLPTKFEIPTPPIPPVKPTATYHFDKATFQTDNTKLVTNTAGTDVNGALVNKNAIEDWHLTNEDLPAGHEVIKNYSIEDKLPDFFVPDLEKCKSLNPTYDVSFDEKTNMFTLTANKAMLEAMNKDLNSAYKVPTAIIEGQVTKDNSSYENNFDTLINDYTVKSNNVEVHTPDPKPEKTNENGSGTTINGQGIDVNATNYYKLLWNTSAYKGAKPTKEDIDKGFFFVDDAPEIVDVDLKNISYKDSNGNTVAGITAKLYSSLNDAPAEVQKALKNSNISPKGQFVFYSADNPQDFFTKYYEAGNDITITQPMSFKEGAKGDYENTDYQIDFGNGYTGDTVKNTIVPPKVTKQVSVDGGKTWHDSKDLPDTDSKYDYSLDYQFTGNGDYTKILFKEAWESSQYADLANIKLFTKDGKEIAGTKKVVNESGKDVTEDYNKHVFQKDGKKEKLYIVFTPDKISDITSLASNDDPNRLVNLTLSIKDVTLKGASGAELANYLEDGKIVTPNTGELITSSKTVTGDNTKDEVTKSNVTKVIPPQLTPMINKYVYETGVGSSINLYDKGDSVPSYLSRMAQFTSLNLNKDEKVKVGDTVHWLVAAQSGNKSLMTNVVDTLPKELSFAENPNIKVFVLKNDGKLGDEVTSDWKIETKGQTLTATPSDPTKYFFVGSSTDSRVVITLDTTLKDDTQSGSFTNVATINTKDGGHKEDKANIHTKVDPVKAIVDIYLPKTGDSKSIMNAVGAWFVTVALIVGVALNERKRHTLMTAINKFKRHIKL